MHRCAAGVEKEHLFVSLSSLGGGSNYVHHRCISNKSGRRRHKKLTSISIMVTLERQPPFKSRLVLFSAPLLLLTTLVCAFESWSGERIRAGVELTL
jgi:hypothetical protein